MISTKTVRVFKLHSWKKQHIVTVTSVPNSRGKSPPFCDHEATSDVSGCPQLDSEQEKSTEPCLEGYYTEDSDRFPSEEHRERTSNSIYKMQEEKLQLDLRGNKCLCAGSVALGHYGVSTIINFLNSIEKGSQQPYSV